MKCEFRGKWTRNPFELRAEGDTVTVEGYAAVFNQTVSIGGWFDEVIAPGAFRAAIPRDDVPFLINHDGLPLARSRAGQGTLSMIEDDHGLKIRTDLDTTDPDVQSIVGKMRRGDLDKMSFAFRAETQEWDETGETPLRTIRKVELFDVSVVTMPAYDGAEIGLRSLEQFRAASARTENFHAARRRLRMRMNLDLRARENG